MCGFSAQHQRQQKTPLESIASSQGRLSTAATRANGRPLVHIVTLCYVYDPDFPAPCSKAAPFPHTQRLSGLYIQTHSHYRRKLGTNGIIFIQIKMWNSVVHWSSCLAADASLLTSRETLQQ